MNQLQETLLILNHFDSLISSRTNYCRRNLNFKINDCVTEKMLQKIVNGAEPKALADDPILTEISRECADVKIILHSYICLNIIDMFSFNDEYNKFFQESRFDDEVVKNRINKVKTKNKEIKKNINWKQLGNFRNNVLAHNLRDNNNYQKISIQTLKDLNVDILSNLERGIQYSEVVLRLFENVKEEFKLEIKEAQKALKEEISKLK